MNSFSERSFESTFDNSGEASQNWKKLDKASPDRTSRTEKASVAELAPPRRFGFSSENDVFEAKFAKALKSWKKLEKA